MIPIDCDGRHAATRAKFVFDRQFVGEGEWRQHVFLDTLNTDQVFWMQLQRPIRRAENMHAPITNQSAAEIVKGAPIEGQIESETVSARKTATATARGGARRELGRLLHRPGEDDAHHARR